MDYTKKGRGIGLYGDTAVNVSATDTTASVFAPGIVYVGQGGTVTLITAEEASVRFSNVQTGDIIPVLATRIAATGTTATAFVIIY